MRFWKNINYCFLNILSDTATTFFLKTIVFLQIFILWRTKRKRKYSIIWGAELQQKEEKFFPASDSGFLDDHQQMNCPNSRSISTEYKNNISILKRLQSETR